MRLPALAAAVLGLQLQLACSMVREYFVKAQEELWDYGPSGVDSAGVRFEGHADADVFMVQQPNSGQIGRRYWKCLWRLYTDASFTVRSARPSWLGIIGPVLHCEVGDTLSITLFNNCSKALTMHPHGVRYGKSFEGALYVDSGNSSEQEAVPSGYSFIYSWTCDERAGPANRDTSSIVWPFHSHNPSIVDVQSGLIGAIIVTARGAAHPDASPRDVDLELVLYLSVTDESKSYLLDRNIDDFIVAAGRPLTEAARRELKQDPHFLEGNMMHGINGYLFGNLQGLRMSAGQRIRWYIFSLGTEVDLHALHWQGHTVLQNGRRVSSVMLMPGVSTVADMVVTHAGSWNIVCSTNDHHAGGMTARYEVLGPSLPLASLGRTREHFIRAVEVVWDYAPSGRTAAGTTLSEDEHASVFLQQDLQEGRIGRKYLKCIYKEYTDASFSTPVVRSSEWRHLGMLGPLLRGEVGDSIKVTYLNSCSKNTSIMMPAAVLLAVNESHDDMDCAVIPGGSKVYQWQVVDGPGPLDHSSIAFLYSSYEPAHIDTNSGLVGALIVSRYGQADADGKPTDVMHELVVLLTVTDEGASYLLDQNIQRFIVDAGQGWTDEQIATLKEDAGFQESNLMHGVNGFLYGNLEPPRLTAGYLTRIYALSVGTEVDMHSLSIIGHPLLVGGQLQAQLNLMPGVASTADFLPTNGTWALICQTNDHFLGGMTAQIEVAAAPADDPLTVHVGLNGRVRRYYIRAEEREWDYGHSGLDLTGLQSQHDEQPQLLTWEHTRAKDFMISNATAGFIGRRRLKCLFVGYDSSFSVPSEDRGPGSPLEHLGALGPILHAEVGDEIEIELRNSCSVPVSIQPQVARFAKEDEGMAYTDSDGVLRARAGQAVAPGDAHVYSWYILDGPGPNDGSSIGTLYYSGAGGVVGDLSAGLKGPLIITRRSSADGAGRPKDIDTEFVVAFEITNEGESYLLGRNIAEFLGAGAVVPDTEAAETSNHMHNINGMMFGNLKGLTARAETIVRWYVLSLGSEADLHSVHWHGHTVWRGGHHVDVVQGMPGAGFTVDMYADNVGKWLIHCHVADHVMDGMAATYEVVPNLDRTAVPTSTCRDLYGRAAEARREPFVFNEDYFEGYTFRAVLSPFFRVAYNVDYINEHFDMVLGVRTTGYVGIGFSLVDDDKDHAMVNTDMIVGYVRDGTVSIEDRFALGLELPQKDSSLGGRDQLSMKKGTEESGITYISFRRSFRQEDLDEFDAALTKDLEAVKVVYAYSSTSSKNLVYHGPTRGFGTLAWNLDCALDHFFSLATSRCDPCDSGYFRLPDDPRFSRTQCERCPVGRVADVPGNRRLNGTSCEPCRHAHTTTSFPGATSFAECVCQPGFFHPCTGDACLLSWQDDNMTMATDSFCVPCPPGMQCQGGAIREGSFVHSTSYMPSLEMHQQPVVPPGFYATGSTLSVFRCYFDAARCPGGILDGIQEGPCLENFEGLQCSRCKAGFTARWGPSCSPCKGSDRLPLFLVMLILLVVILAIYRASAAAPNSAGQSQSMLLVAVTGSQIVTALQMLGAVGSMSIEWPREMMEGFEIASALNFDIEALRLECIGQVSALGHCFIRLAVLLFILLAIVLVHVVHVLVWHGGHFSKHVHLLVNATGAVMMTFFLSMLALAMAPLQCTYKHPNGLSTLRHFPTVVCWEAEEHGAMRGISALASVPAVAVLLITGWAVKEMPARLRAGDERFVFGFTFLSFRFRLSANWYPMFFLARNLLICVVPISPDTCTQVVMMLLVLMASLAVTLHFKPWRIWQANALETCSLVSLILIVGMSPLFMADQDNTRPATFCLFLVVLNSVLCFLSVVYGLATRVLRSMQTRPIAFCICHNERTDGAAGRLLKVCLMDSVGTELRVMLDAERQLDLSALVDCINHQVHVVVALCSRSIARHTRAMCVLSTARRKALKTVRVDSPNFQDFDERWTEQYHRVVMDMSEFMGLGITLAALQATLGWLGGLQRIELTSKSVAMGLEWVAEKLMINCLDSKPHGSVAAWQAPVGDANRRSSSGVVVVDHTNTEAVCAAHLLKRCLAQNQAWPGLDVAVSLRLLSPSGGSSWAEEAGLLLLTCSGGMFSAPGVLCLCHQAVALGVPIVPVVVDMSFVHPTREGLEEWLSDMPESGALSVGEMASKLDDVFRQVIYTFQPQSHICTEQQVEAISARIAEHLAVCLALPASQREHSASGEKSSLELTPVLPHSPSLTHSTSANPSGMLEEALRADSKPTESYGGDLVLNVCTQSNGSSTTLG